MKLFWIQMNVFPTPQITKLNQFERNKQFERFFFPVPTFTKKEKVRLI